MAPTLPDVSNDALQIRGLKNFLTWITCVAAVTTCVYGMTWLFNRQLLPLVMSLGGLLSTVGLGVSRLLLGRGLIQLGLIISAATVLLAGLIFAAIAPVLLPVLGLLPILALAISLPYSDSRWIVRIGVIGFFVSVIMALFARRPLFSETLPPHVETLLVALLLPVASATTLMLLWLFHRRLNQALEHAAQANSALRTTHAGLEEQVAARTAELRTALEELRSRADAQAGLLIEIEQQRQAIRELSVLVLPVAHRTLVLPLIGAIDSARIQQLQDQALLAVERSNARRLLFDITGVSVVDTEVARGLIQAISAARLLGAESVLVDIRPEVAQTIVGLGLDLGPVHTFPDLETALAASVR